MSFNNDSIHQPFVIIMIIVIIFLLLVIKSLSAVLLSAARGRRAAEKAAGDAGQGAGTVTDGKDAGRATGDGVASGQPPGLLAGIGVMAVATDGSIVSGLSDTGFYMLIGVVGVEILVIFYLVFNLGVLIRQEAAAAVEAGADDAEADGVRSAKRSQAFASWWNKMNRFRPVAEEAGLVLDHEYDGIRELDNKLPPWWLYGFYCTIVVACIYLWRFHVVHSAPLPAEEYRIAVADAAVQKEAYLKKAANNVDENTVKLLTDAPALESGKAVFQSTCFACHGKNGEGGVGPNLTDGYWLHGGSIQEVFKTIKYGWPEKGMKSWKDDLSPVQIAQIASYVKSLAGTNPPNAKAPQGTLVK